MITYIPELPLSPCSLGEFNFFKKLPTRRALQELGPNDPKLNMRMAESLLTISADHFVKKWNFDPILMKPVKGKFIWTPVNQEKKIPLPDNVVRPRPITGTIREQSSYTTHSDTCVSTEISSCSRIPTPEGIEESSHSDGNLKLPIQSGNKYHSAFHNVDRSCNISNLGITLGLQSEEVPAIIHSPPKSTHKTPSKSRAPSSQPRTPKTRQCKITEYGRQRKRLYSNSKSDEEKESSPRKKILLEATSSLRT